MSPDRAALRRGLRRAAWPGLAMMIVVALSAHFSTGPADAEVIEEAHPLTEPVLTETVNGNLLTFGNSILECDSEAESIGTGSCDRMHAGHSPNNQSWMKKADVDDIGSTRSSSRASVRIPAGAKVRRAVLSYGGTRGAIGKETRCTPADSTRSTVPADAPLDSNVSVQTGAQPVSVAPAKVYATGQFYAGWADVTSVFAGVSDGTKQSVTVGNIPTPEGYGCGVGWSIALAYEFDDHDPAAAESAPHKVYFYAGLQPQRSDGSDTMITATGFTAYGSDSSIAVTAAEGDATYTGDSLAWAADDTGLFAPILNPDGEADNFFTARAVGQTPFPDYPDMIINGGIDVAQQPIALPPGATSLTLRSRTRSDGFALQAVTLSVPVAGVTIVKTAADTDADAQVLAEGDIPKFRITVSNTSTVDLESIKITDDTASDCTRTIKGSPASPALPSDDDITFTCQGSPMETGPYTSTATVEAMIAGATVATDTDPTAVEYAAIALEKKVLDDGLSEGTPAHTVDAEVRYGFTVRNPGSAPIADVAVTDPLLGGKVDCPASSIEAGGSLECKSGTYSISADDLAAGTVSNTATATAVAADDIFVSATDKVELTLTRSAALSLTTSIHGVGDDNANGRLDPGDTVDFGFTVRNVGTLPVSAIQLDAPLINTAVECAKTDLDPGENTSCGPAKYTLQVNDLDARGLTNIATVTGKSPDGEEVTATGRVGLGVTAVSQLELEKTASQLVDANHSGSLDPGDTVAFSFRLTNTGSDTLTKINISDPMLSADALDCPATSLAPSESSTCGPYPYTLKKSDLEEGSLTNEASASASSADGPIPKSVATARVELAGTGSLPLPDETTEPSPSEQPDPGTTPDGSANAGSANGESTAGGSGNDDSAASGANSADADSTSDVSGDSDSAAGDSATGGSANGDATTGESESGGSADGSGELAESGGSSDALLGSYAAGLLLIGSVAALRIGRRRTP